MKRQNPAIWPRFRMGSLVESPIIASKYARVWKWGVFHQFGGNWLIGCFFFSLVHVYTAHRASVCAAQQWIVLNTLQSWRIYIALTTQPMWTARHLVWYFGWCVCVCVCILASSPVSTSYVFVLKWWALPPVRLHIKSMEKKKLSLIVTPKLKCEKTSARSNIEKKNLGRCNLMAPYMRADGKLLHKHTCCPLDKRCCAGRSAIWYSHFHFHHIVNGFWCIQCATNLRKNKM